MIRKYFAIIILSLGFVFSSWAFEPEVRSKVNKATAEVGEEILFTVEVRYPVGSSVEFEEVGEKILGLRVIDFSTSEPEKDEEHLVVVKSYNLEGDVSGSYVLPAVNVSVIAKDGSKSELQSGEIFVDITAGDGKKKKLELRDIKDLSRLPQTLSWLGWSLIGLVVLVLFGVIFWFIRKRRLKGEGAIEKPYWEVAKEELDLLKTRTGEQKAFHFKLSHVLRLFMEGHSEMSFSDMTTEEVERVLNRNTTIESKLKESFLSILKSGDLVKYADAVKTREENDDLLKQGIQLVEDLSPKEKSEEESVI